MASNKQSKLKDIVDEGFVQSTKVKIHSRSPVENGKWRMFYALLTDGMVYRKIAAFGQASISLQHVEEWKYYELTNLKAKKPRDTRYMNSCIEFMATSTTKATETTRTRGLKKDFTQLLEVVALDDIYEFYTNKSWLNFFFSKMKKIRETPKREKPEKHSFVRSIYPKQKKKKGKTTRATLVLLRSNETRSKIAKPNPLNLLW